MIWLSPVISNGYIWLPIQWIQIFSSVDNLKILGYKRWMIIFALVRNSTKVFHQRGSLRVSDLFFVVVKGRYHGQAMAVIVINYSQEALYVRQLYP